MLRAFAFITLIGLASSAFGQTIFEPVQYQYGTSTKVYYGGNDPVVIEALKSEEGFVLYVDGHFFRQFGWIPAPAPLYPGINAKVVDERPIIYRDPGAPGPRTVAEVRNQAYNNVPRFFRMSDLQATAIETPHGRVIPAVPPRTPGVRVYSAPPVVAAPRVAPADQPARQPAPIIIIPKKALEQKAKPAGQVVLAEEK